jgi:hypothetical protein
MCMVDPLDEKAWSRIRWVSSKLTIKDGFKRDMVTYQSHYRYTVMWLAV